MFALGNEISNSRFMPKGLHTSHLGIKTLAHVHVWWPGHDKCIEQLVTECKTCQSVKNNPLTLSHPWSLPDAHPFQGSLFMIIVDAHSKWLKVVPMSTTKTEKSLKGS